MTLQQETYRTGLKLNHLIELRNFHFSKAEVLVNDIITKDIDTSKPLFTREQVMLFDTIQALQNQIDKNIDLIVSNRAIEAVTTGEQCDLQATRITVLNHYGLNEKQWNDCNWFINVFVRYSAKEMNEIKSQTPIKLTWLQKLKKLL